MKVELIFVDTAEQTKRGFYRGFIALLLFYVLFFAWHWLFQSVYPKYIQDWQLWVGALIFGILFASAIAVAHPTDIKTALTYGGLVGFVVFGCVNATLFTARYQWWVALFDTLFGVLLGMANAATLFYLK